MSMPQEYKMQPYKGNRKKKGARQRAPVRGVVNSAYAPGPAYGASSISGMVVRSLPLFGYVKRAKVQYYQNVSVASGASTAGAYVFSANGLYDPDVSGTGGQPMGFDQMMSFFNHYTVTGAKITVIAQTNSTSLRSTIGLLVSGSSTATTSIQQLVENGDCQFYVLSYAGQFGGTCTMTRRLNVGRFQSVADVMDDPSMRGDAASNPAEQAYFHIVCWNAASATTISVDCQVLIEYDAVFHEPRKGPLS